MKSVISECDDFDTIFNVFFLFQHIQEQHQTRMVCSGHVSCLAASPDSAYCIGGIEEKLNIWQVQ